MVYKLVDLGASHTFPLVQVKPGVAGNALIIFTLYASTVALSICRVLKLEYHNLPSVSTKNGDGTSPLRNNSYSLRFDVYFPR